MQSAAWPVPDARSRSDQGDVTTSGAAHGRRRLHRGVPCSMLSSHQDHQPSCGLLLSCVHLQGTSLFSSVCRADCHWCSSCYQEVVAASGLCAPFQLERDNQGNTLEGCVLNNHIDQFRDKLKKYPIFHLRCASSLKHEEISKKFYVS
nr:uncharacterized protein LOC127314552 isoform X1 [Lolium perenne]